MILSCPNCSQQISIDDAKIPEGVFKVRCTKCSKIITSEGRRDQISEDIPPAIQQYVKSQMEGLKQELIRQDVPNRPNPVAAAPASAVIDGNSQDATVRRAMICDSEASSIEAISRALEKMGYTVEVIRTAAEALKKVDSDLYQTVVVGSNFSDDKDGARKIIGRMNGQKSLQRRQTFVVLTSPHLRTGDLSSAFINGANWIVNKADLANFASSVAEGQQLFRQMYTLFNRVVAERDAQI